MKIVRGGFLSVEGIDLSGKTTAMEYVLPRLDQSYVELIRTREPGGTLVAEKLRTFLFENSNDMDADTEAMLFYAARIEHCRRVITPALDEGKLVISDRYSDSTFAYQGAKGRGNFVPLVHDFLESLTAIEKPELTLLFDIPVETYVSRKISRGVVLGEEINAFEDRDLEYFEKVLSIYRGKAEAHPERFIVINANESIESCREQVIEAFLSRDYII